MDSYSQSIRDDTWRWSGSFRCEDQSHRVCEDIDWVNQGWKLSLRKMLLKPKASRCYKASIRIPLADQAFYTQGPFYDLADFHCQVKLELKLKALLVLNLRTCWTPMNSKQWNRGEQSETHFFFGRWVNFSKIRLDGIKRYLWLFWQVPPLLVDEPRLIYIYIEIFRYIISMSMYVNVYIYICICIHI